MGDYLLKGVTPYALQNQSRVASTGGGLAARLAPFAGITPAPGSITRSRFQNYVTEAYHMHNPSAVKTPEQAGQTQKFFDALAQMPQGNKPDLKDFTPKEQQSLRKYATTNPIQTHFNRLDLEQKLKAYDLASPQERQQFGLPQGILKHAQTQLAKVSADVRKTVQTQVNRVAMMH